jgi:TonB family protein
MSHVGTAMEPTTPSAPSTQLRTDIGSNLLLKPRRSAARRWLVIVSFVLHGGAIAAYLLFGLLQVERLSPERGRIEVSLARRMSDPGGGLEPGEKPKTPRPPKPEDKRVTKDRVQPVETPPVVAPEQTPTTGGGGNNLTPGTGNDNLPPGGQCEGADCSDDPDAPIVATGKAKPAVVEQKEDKFVPPVDMKKKRLGGDTQIVPDQVTRTAMSRDGKSSWTGIVKFCIDTSGRVKSASMAKPTGYPAYDALLLRGVRQWTYSAHTVGGTPVPACSTVKFDFSMQ